MAIEQEPKSTAAGVPPAYWPASGNLHVENLSARYSVNGPNVLQDVSFEVKSGERIGVGMNTVLLVSIIQTNSIIVGRTGSGKSSLTLSLLRCIFTEGNMLYDGIQTTSLNLEALRSNITIIPQVVRSHSFPLYAS
jgi:ABC-type multidrug transport system fused ATPase/permease subunit